MTVFLPLAAATVLATYAGFATAQPFPSKPVELVSPTGVGGGSDLVARVVADIVAREKLLPQPLVVVNRAGGGGAIGQDYVARKRADPYSVLLAGTSLLTVPLRTGMDIGLDKFQPLGMIGIDINALVVNGDSPYRTTKELVAAARANPKSVNIAITFPGGTAHNLMYQIEKASGARFNLVSFKSGSDAVTAVLGGHVHATAENLGEIMPHVESRKLRVLGIPGSKRLAGLPDIATLKEQGFEAHSGAFRGFASPAGIPRDAVTALEDMLANVYRHSAWKDYMAKNLYEDVYMNADEFGRYLAARQVEIARYLGELGLVLKK